MNLKVYSRRQLMSFIKPYDAEIEYLESTGTQYINAGIIPYRGLEATMDFQYTYLNNNQSLFGSWKREGPIILYEVTLYNSKWYFGSYSSSEYNVPWLNNTIDTKRHIVSIDGNGSISQDGVLLITKNVSDNNNNIPVYVFAKNVSGSIENPSFIRCYSFKLKDNNTPILDLIPVRVGNVGYMYDKVSGELFGNVGSGDFILGPDINK